MKDQECANKKKKVFVIHGRNKAASDAVFKFLQDIGLEPIEWREAINLSGSAAPFIGQILNSAFDNAQAAVVVMTGDDEARLRDQFIASGDELTDEQDLTPQARANVIFEAGMALARHPKRTVILEFGTLRPFSDIAGRHVVRMANTKECRVDIAMRLQTANCTVNLERAKTVRTNFKHAIALSNRATPAQPRNEPSISPASTEGNQDDRLDQDSERLLIAIARAWPRNSLGRKFPGAMGWDQLKSQHQANILVEGGYIIRVHVGEFQLSQFGKSYLERIQYFDQPH